MSQLPLAGLAARVLPLLALLLSALALTACGDEDEPEVEVPEDPSNIDNPDLLGYWVVTQVNGDPVAADTEIRYQFTPQGDFIRYEGDDVARSRYTFAAPGQITIDGPTGTTFYDYQLDDDELTLQEPGENGDSMRLRKLADVDLEDIPPPTAVPEEDSVPGDTTVALPDTLG